MTKFEGYFIFMLDLLFPHETVASTPCPLTMINLPLPLPLTSLTIRSHQTAVFKVTLVLLLVWMML